MPNNSHIAISSFLRDDASDTSSSVSQTSYDPNRPNLKSGASEIPELAADDDVSGGEEAGGVTLVSAKASPSAKGFSFPKFNWKPSKGGKSGSDDGGAGIVLLTSRSLESQHSASDPNLSSGGITLISKKILDTGYQDIDVSSTTSDLTNTSTSMMVSEPEDSNSGRFTLNISGTPAAQDNPAPNKRGHNQFHSGPIWEWNTEHVCHWLLALELDRYTEVFQEKHMTGAQLLQLDGSKLKAMGITNSKDRELLKKKIKEMKANVEKEKKLQEKERKLKEKETKKMAKKK